MLILAPDFFPISRIGAGRFLRRCLPRYFFFRLSSFQRSERWRRRWRRRAGGTQDRSSFHQSRSYGTPQTIRHGESGRRASMVLIVIVGTLVRWSFRYEMIGIKMLWNILFILYINSITDQRPLLTFSCIFFKFHYFSLFMNFYTFLLLIHR